MEAKTWAKQRDEGGQRLEARLFVLLCFYLDLMARDPTDAHMMPLLMNRQQWDSPSVAGGGRSPQQLPNRGSIATIKQPHSLAFTARSGTPHRAEGGLHLGTGRPATCPQPPTIKKKDTRNFSPAGRPSSSSKVLSAMAAPIHAGAFHPQKAAYGSICHRAYV